MYTFLASGRMLGTAIGLDVGGTKIAGGVVRGDGTVLEDLPPHPTPPGDAAVTVLVEAISELRRRHPDVEAVGVGAAGTVEWPEGFIRWAPNNSYVNLPLGQILADATGLPTIVDNDANVAAWAERRVARTAENMLFVTVGTGVGCGVILDGQLFRGRHGLGPELGHITVDAFGGQQCGCGNYGCLEALAAGPALARMGQLLVTQEPDGGLAQLSGSPGKVTGELVHAAAEAGDPGAQALYRRVGDWLGIGIASLMAIVDVDDVIIGGGVAAAGGLLLAPLREGLLRHLYAKDHRSRPRVVSASMGSGSGWIGAALLALDSCAP